MFLVRLRNKMKFKDSYKWTEIAHELNQNANTDIVRLGKHCRERWYNHLDPYMKKFFLNYNNFLYFSSYRGEWGLEEDIFILESILENGKKWAKISKNLDGRTENAVKNRFITLVRHHNKVNSYQKKKREKTNPLDTPNDIIRLILNSLSRSPMLQDSPLKHKKTEDSNDFYNSPYSSPMSELEDEIEEQHMKIGMEEELIKNHENTKNHSNNSPELKSEEKPLIRLQEVKTMESVTSISEENKKNFESVDSDFKRINKLKSMDSPKLLLTNISPINFNQTNESIHNLDSHLDISPNVHYPAFSKISEKSQEDMPSMEFLEEKLKKKNEVYKHSISTPLNMEGNRSYFEKMLQRMNSNSKNLLDNSNSAQFLKTYNSFYSGKSKISLEHSFGFENFNVTEENFLPFLLQHEQLKSQHKNLNENSLNDYKKNEEKSPIINSLNNLNLSDSPKLFSPHEIAKKPSNINNKSGSFEAGKEESLFFSKKDSCSNFLNLDRTELMMNSMFKNLEE